MNYKTLVLQFLIFLSLLLFSSKAYAAIPLTTDTRIKTLVYSPNEIFQLKFHYNYQSYIEFPDYETIELVSVGDRYAWRIQKIENRLFVKPTQSGVKTNMTVMTDERIYHFEIVSSMKSYNEIDDDLVLVAKFFYPEQTYDYLEAVRVKRPLELIEIEEEENKILDAQINAEQKRVNQVAQNVANEIVNVSQRDKSDRIVDLNPGQENIETDLLALNYQYSMIGSDSVIAPVKVHDNGRNTFFEFSVGVLPDVYYVDEFGNESIVQYYIQDGVVIVDGVSRQFSLRSGNDLVCIFNENIN